MVLRVTIKHSDATVKVAGVASSTACAASVELPATQPSVPVTAVKTMKEKRLLRLGWINNRISQIHNARAAIARRTTARKITAFATRQAWAVIETSVTARNALITTGLHPCQQVSSKKPKRMLISGREARSQSVHIDPTHSDS